MTPSDEEFLAPVINLFGERSRAVQTDPESMDSSSEAVEAPSVLRALPTLADFSPAAHENDDHRAAYIEPMAAAASAAPTQSERRQSRDGFSEISRISMRALARRGMSSFEMTQFLGTREFDSAEIDAEVERLEGSGLLDDAALAETLTRTLRERKGLGASAISAELRRRKIDQEHISAVLDEPRDDEQDRAIEIALKRAPQLRSLDSVTAKRRLSGFLLRRGYSGSIVSTAVAAALEPGSNNSSGGPVFR